MVIRKFVIFQLNIYFFYAKKSLDIGQIRSVLEIVKSKLKNSFGLNSKIEIFLKLAEV